MTIEKLINIIITEAKGIFANYPIMALDLEKFLYQMLGEVLTKNMVTEHNLQVKKAIIMNDIVSYIYGGVNSSKTKQMPGSINFDEFTIGDTKKFLSMLEDNLNAFTPSATLDIATLDDSDASSSDGDAMFTSDVATSSRNAVTFSNKGEKSTGKTSFANKYDQRKSRKKHFQQLMKEFTSSKVKPPKASIIAKADLRSKTTSTKTPMISSIGLRLPTKNSLDDIKKDLKNIISLDLLSETFPSNKSPITSLSDNAKKVLIEGVNEYIEKYFFQHVPKRFDKAIDFDQCGDFEFGISVDRFMKHATARPYGQHLKQPEYCDKLKLILNNCFLENSFTTQPRFKDLNVLKDRLYFNVVKYLHLYIQKNPLNKSQIASLLKNFNEFIYGYLPLGISGNMPSAAEVKTIKRFINDTLSKNRRYRHFSQTDRDNIINIMEKTLDEYLSYASKNVQSKTPAMVVATSSSATVASSSATVASSSATAASSSATVASSSATAIKFTEFSFENNSTQDEIRKLTQDPNLRVVAVNLANMHSIGGGCTKGAMAQEESLCYTSNLYLSLLNSPLGHFQYKVGEKPYYGLDRNNVTPIPHDSIIFSENVEFSYEQQPDQVTFTKITRPFSCDMITIAGYNLAVGENRHKSKQQGVTVYETLGKLNCKDPNELKLITAYDDDLKAIKKSSFPGGYEFPILAEKFTELTAEKIKLMLRSALAKNNNAIVLGAISCGAFKFNTLDRDPIQLKDPDNWTAKCVCDAYAKAFEELLKENVPLDQFKKISFAVTGDNKFPNVVHFSKLPERLNKIFHAHHLHSKFTSTVTDPTTKPHSSSRSKTSM